MPRACPVESHVRRYTHLALMPRCHGLAPWSLTFAATHISRECQDPTGLPRGVSRSPLHTSPANAKMPRACPVESHVRRYTHLARMPRSHGLAPWSLTFAATHISST